MLLILDSSSQGNHVGRALFWQSQDFWKWFCLKNSQSLIAFSGASSLASVTVHTLSNLLTFPSLNFLSPHPMDHHCPVHWHVKLSAGPGETMSGRSGEGLLLASNPVCNGKPTGGREGPGCSLQTPGKAPHTSSPSSVEWNYLISSTKWRWFIVPPQVVAKI